MVRTANDRPGGAPAVSYAVVGAAGITAWLAGSSMAVQAIGFSVAVLSQIAAILSARRVGVPAPRLRDDSAVELGLNRRAH